MARIGILTKILAVMLIVSLIAIGSMAWIGFSGIGLIKSETLLRTSSALEAKTNTHLEQIVVDQAEQSEQLLSGIKNMLIAQEKYILDAYYNPENYAYVPQKLTSSFAGPNDPVPVGAPDDYQSYDRFCKDCMVSFKYIGIEAKPGLDLHYDMNGVLTSSNSDILADLMKFSSIVSSFKTAIFEHKETIVWLNFGSEKGIFYGYPAASLPSDYDVTQRDWYKLAVEKRDFSWTEPYVDAGGAGLMITAVKPVYAKDKKLIGVLSADVTIDILNKKIANLKVGESGYSYLIDNAGNVLAKPDYGTTDTRWDESFKAESLLTTENKDLNAITKKMLEGEKGTALVTLSGERKYVVYAPIKSLGWSLAAVLPEEEALKDVKMMSNDIDNSIKLIANQILLGILMLVVLIIFVSVLFAHGISKPVKSLKEAADKVTNGDFDVKIPRSKIKDEVSDLAASMEMLVSAYKVKMSEQEAPKEMPKETKETKETAGVSKETAKLSKKPKKKKKSKKK